jgi:DNA-binding XRE family transcriptional regulator
MLNLRQLRERHAYTQREIGEIVGVGYVSVCRWENGVMSPKMPHRRRLAEFFGVPVWSIDWNVSRQPQPTP